MKRRCTAVVDDGVFFSEFDDAAALRMVHLRAREATKDMITMCYYPINIDDNSVLISGTSMTQWRVERVELLLPLLFLFRGLIFWCGQAPQISTLESLLIFQINAQLCCPNGVAIAIATVIQPRLSFE